jgi:coenzyme PQQ precursor peptide PqqA
MFLLDRAARPDGFDQWRVRARDGSVAQSRRGKPAAFWRKPLMSWKKPRITEICLGLEINAYASATV